MCIAFPPVFSTYLILHRLGRARSESERTIQMKKGEERWESSFPVPQISGWLIAFGSYLTSYLVRLFFLVLGNSALIKQGKAAIYSSSMAHAMTRVYRHTQVSIAPIIGRRLVFLLLLSKRFSKYSMDLRQAKSGMRHSRARRRGK